MHSGGRPIPEVPQHDTGDDGIVGRTLLVELKSVEQNPGSFGMLQCFAGNANLFLHRAELGGVNDGDTQPDACSTEGYAIQPFGDAKLPPPVFALLGVPLLLIGILLNSVGIDRGHLLMIGAGWVSGAVGSLFLLLWLVPWIAQWI
jgi:hypothetical protein